MLKILCEGCGKVLKEPGGLLFDPPVGGSCYKLHLCKKCHGDVRSFVRRLATKSTAAS